MMFKKVISLFFIIILMVSLLIGCSGVETSKEGDASRDAEQIENITVVLEWVPNTNHTGLYVAMEKGYYEEEGLEVEIIQPTAGGSADLIAAKQGEFGLSHQEQMVYARTAEDPLPVKAIAAIIQHNTSGMASPAYKNITSPKDFEGKEYGGWGSPIEEAILKGLMDKVGGDFGKVGIVDIGTSDFFTSVENHVDFSWIYYGWDGVASEVKGFDINFIRLQDIEEALEFYTPVIIAHEELLNDNPELAKRFLKATTKGYEFAIENPEEAGQIFLKHVPELDEEIVIPSQKYLSKEYKADAEKWGEMKTEVWSNYANWMYENDLLENPLEAEEAFTNEFLPRR